jgi:hypothetical protein
MVRPQKTLSVLLQLLPCFAVLGGFGVLELALARWLGVWGVVGGWLLILPAAPFIHVVIHSWRRVVWRLTGTEPWRESSDDQRTQRLSSRSNAPTCDGR